MTKDEKKLEFHEMMIKKAVIERDFWIREISFHEDKILRLINKEDKFMSCKVKGV